MDKKSLIVLFILFLGMIFLKSMNFFKNKKENNIIILLVIACLAILLKSNYNQVVFGEQLTLYLPLIYAMILIVIILELNKKTFYLKFDSILMLLFLILIIIPFQRNKIYNIVRFWTLYDTYLSIFFIGIMFRTIKGYNYEKILNFFSYIAIYNGFLSIFQFITNKKLLIGQFNNNINFFTETGQTVKRVVGIAITNNSAGNLGVLLFCVVLFNYLRTRKKIHLFALIITSVFSILTLTRIGYIGILVVTLVNIIAIKWNSMSKIIRNFIIIFLGLVCIALILHLFGDKIYYILFEQRGKTQDARLLQFDYIFNNIINKNNLWSGIGTGQYTYYAYNFLSHYDLDIHSEYLNILTENGMLAFGIFTTFNIYLFRIALKKCESKLENVFIISLFLSNLICCNFNPNQYYEINNFIYYIILYCIICKKYIFNGGNRFDKSQYNNPRI